MADRQHEDHNLIVEHVVDDAVVADADPHLAATAFELLATGGLGRLASASIAVRMRRATPRSSLRRDFSADCE